MSYTLPIALTGLIAYLGTLDLAVDTGARVTVVFPGTLVCKHPVGEDTCLGLGEQVSGHCKGERYTLRLSSGYKQCILKEDDSYTNVSIELFNKT